MPSVLRGVGKSLLAFVRSAIATFVTLTVLRELAGRVRRGALTATGGRTSDVLPSLYDRYPRATVAARRRLGLRTVPVDEIVGTARDPSQNTADFLPLPMLRGKNWDARWDRILRALNDLRVLPPVDLFKVGDEYYVIDGHNRIAAARRVGQVAVDADVVELVIPGVEADAPTRSASALIGADELWQAGGGRQSATFEQRTVADTLSRSDLLRVVDAAPPPPDAAADAPPAEPGNHAPASDGEPHAASDAAQDHR